MGIDVALDLIRDGVCPACVGLFGIGAHPC